MPENWKNFLDDASQDILPKTNPDKRQHDDCKQLLKAISSIAADHSLQPSTRLTIIQLIVKDGLDGGKISINTVKKLIGSPSTQTALSVLKVLEEREIIVRVRSHLGSTYTFTQKFLRKFLYSTIS